MANPTTNTDPTIRNENDVSVTVKTESFLKENWPYIVLPILIVAVLLGVVLMMAEGDSEAPFVYNVF